jgi:hypothetical protein
MGKLKFMILKERQFTIVVDSLRAYVALRTEEYHDKPSTKTLDAMTEAVETLDLFIKPKRQESNIEKRVKKNKIKA